MSANDTDIRELDDPALMTQWSAARQRLAMTPRDSPEHGSVKASYDALASEYRRRIDGWI
jgi:hypothetical protein